MSIPEHPEIPFPLPPSPGPFTSGQLSIFAAIADTIVPSFSPREGNRLLHHPLRAEIYDDAVKRIQHLGASRELATAYLAEGAWNLKEFRDIISMFLGLYVPENNRNKLLMVLSVLNTRAGSLLLTGYATTLDSLPIRDREQIIQGWASSRIPAIRALHTSLTTLIRVFWLRVSPNLGDLLTYPRLPKATAPGKAYPFEFIQIPAASSDEPEVLETDVVIVGSGCGGAVVAKTLAEAGLKVLVVEQKYYWPPKYLPMNETNAGLHMFGNDGVFSSEDGSTTIINGATWGGGGAVNWSASLQPQGIVRREWAQKFGLKHFQGAAFQADLDFVCERMGVGYDAVQHNKGNRVLMEGARKLGWSAKPVAQNTGGEVHSDGFCTNGCRDCGKKGPTVTFLPDAANAGARFMEGYKVNEILFGQPGADGDRPVVGVKGLWTSRDSHGGVIGSDKTTREVIVKARKTIISGGAVYSPNLLQRSGLKNPHIGRHLHLHPVLVVAAVWDEDVLPWEGPILTSVCNEFENLDGQGYGPKLEATTMIPASFLPMFPWTSGQQWKEFAGKMRRMTGYISLTRDRYGGRVYPDPKDGRCLIDYRPLQHDKKHILEGVIALAEILYVEGAREIHPAIPGIDPFTRPASVPADKILLTPNNAPSSTDSEFRAWIAKLRAHGLPAPQTGFASAHQMGSCRMGTSPRNSVVDYKGRVWGSKGLYIADTSVFPSASGVNPMITCMGIARNIARGIVDDERGVEGVARARL